MYVMVEGVSVFRRLELSLLALGLITFSVTAGAVVLLTVSGSGAVCCERGPSLGAGEK